MAIALTTSPRVRRMWLFRLAGPGGALALIGASAALFAAVPGPTRIIGPTAMIALAIGWVSLFAWLTARQEDEFTQAGSKFAWYWGALFGIAASAPVCFFVAAGGLALIPALHAGTDPSRAGFFIFGYMMAIASQMAGYLVVRACWPRR